MSLLCRVLVLTERKQYGARPHPLVQSSHRVVPAEVFEQFALLFSPHSLSIGGLRTWPIALALPRGEAVFAVLRWPEVRNGRERDCIMINRVRRAIS